MEKRNKVLKGITSKLIDKYINFTVSDRFHYAEIQVLEMSNLSMIIMVYNGGQVVYHDSKKETYKLLMS